MYKNNQLYVPKIISLFQKFIIWIFNLVFLLIPWKLKVRNLDFHALFWLFPSVTYEILLLSIKNDFHHKQNWWQHISIQKIIWMNSFGQYWYIFHISNISITLFLSTQLFPGEKNHLTKYNQKKNKTIIYDKIKVIHRKWIKK